MQMRWENLLFAHWRVPPDLLRSQIPPELDLDRFDNEAWLGIVPFRMCDTRLRGLPPIPGVSSFLELNVRTYVTLNGKRGVWFFSLDAASRLAVRAARRFFHLPYFDASMSAKPKSSRTEYSSRRTHRGALGVEFRAVYWPQSESSQSLPGSLEHWLTERYCFFTVDGSGRLACCEIHHLPWPLRLAGADVALNTMAEPLGIELPPIPDALHFAERLEVLGWPLRRV
ncbi:MAG: DUF2071 domain-containing protein [Verrucomicrobia bacterium]|nr:DUF2071 domain-containing protein [Verrucomicrobiota bacterium]